MFTIESARALLTAADVFFDDDEDDVQLRQALNMNDTWAWACADGEHVPDEELPRVAELFWRYGNCGLLYWVSERSNGLRSEFADINRFIEFVRHEEAIRSEVPDSATRAYERRQYVVGGEVPPNLKEHA
jgi:hypothetical protein